MDPGEFNTRVDLIRDIEVGLDAVGAPIIERQVVARPWAKLTYPGGREFLSNDGVTTEKKAVIRMYARRDVDTDTTIVAAGTTYDVKDVRPFDDVIEIMAVGR